MIFLRLPPVVVEHCFKFLFLLSCCSTYLNCKTLYARHQRIGGPKWANVVAVCQAYDI